VRDEDGTVALDTTIAIDSESNTVDLSLSVPVTSPNEPFTLTLQVLSPTGAVVFSAGPLPVTASTSGDNVVAAEVPLSYVGVGSNAASVQIMSGEPFVQFGDTLTLTAEALDGSGTEIQGTPIKWTSLDTVRALVPDAGAGSIVGNRQRGPVNVEALLLTGPADTFEVIVEPVPNALAIVSGDAQTGPALQQLPAPLVVAVTAIDGLGVPDITVDFTTGGGGSFGQASVITDADGLASTTWTLGSGEGAQTATATVADLGQVTFTTTATAEILFRDDFEDGDFVGWTCFDESGISDGQFFVQNGELTIVGPDNSDEKICLAGDTTWTDYAFEASVTNVGGIDENTAGLLFRADTVVGATYALLFSGREQLIALVALSEEPVRYLGSKPFAFTDGETFRLRVEVYGTTITAYVDGAPEFQFDDQQMASGQIALYVFESEARFDDRI
jgi:hypothetical protein